MQERPRITDQLVVAGGFRRPTDEEVGMYGWGTAKVFGPDGELKQETFFKNLITDVGDEYYGERAAGIASPPGQVTGMKLGTGTTAVAKTGAGAALVTYLSNSHQAIDGGYPASSQPGGAGTARRIQWRTTWAAGKATGNSIAEVVLVIDALADATSTAANTIARALLSPVVNKGASDTLEVTWNHDLLGA